MTASASIQEYLEALYKLTGGDADHVVSTTELAAQMSVSAPSASEMLRRLEHLGLVAYLPYQGASLTRRGVDEGSRVVRYHRLWERMLVDTLAMSWDEVHDEACRLEHATSPRLAEALSRFLDHPTTCPHGYAVPAETDRPHASDQEDPSVALLDAPTGFSGHVVSVAEEPELLKYCAGVGLVPGARVEVVHVHPLDELVEVAVRDIPAASSGGDGDKGGSGKGSRSGGRLTVGARVGRLVRVVGDAGIESHP